MIFKIVPPTVLSPLIPTFTSITEAPPHPLAISLHTLTTTLAVALHNHHHHPEIKTVSGGCETSSCSLSLSLPPQHHVS